MSKAYLLPNPCKGCKERVVGCHGVCKKHHDWKKSGIEIVTNPLPWDEMKRGGKRR